MRRYFFEALALLLLAGSLVFLYECASYLSRRDYVASLILMVVGLAVLNVGREIARLALVQRD